jgi:hypothetical protein
MFPTRVRLSGMAIGTQIGFALGGLAPTVASAIAGPGPGGWVPVAAMTLGASVLAALAILTARETYDKTLREIDGRPAPGQAPAPAAAVNRPITGGRARRRVTVGSGEASR